MSELASFHEFLSHKVQEFGTSASPFRIGTFKCAINAGYA